MRDPKRIEIILNLLKEVWESSPDLRFLQLVENIVFCHYADHILYLTTTNI